MDFRKKVSDFFKTTFPQGLPEWCVFLFFLLVYGVLGSFIAQNYRIIFDDRIPWDAYFSFDNRSIVMTGGGFERHPLSNYFFDQIRALALLFSRGRKDANFRLVLAFFSNVTVSFALLQIFKYLKNIIRLPLFWSVFLVLFTGVFSTSILLSFTPETYTYTFAVLCFFNYYSALKLRKEQKIPLAALTIGAVGVGGLTVTNLVKIYIPVVFEKNLFKKAKKFWNAAFRVGFSAVVFILLYLNRLHFDYHKIFEKTGEQYEKFSHPKAVPVWDMVASWFFGGNVLFSGFVIRDYHSMGGFGYKALFMEVYTSAIPYIFISVLMLMVVWSVFKNFKNPLVMVLALSFLVDVAIHCVLKFGLHTSYIYGGHFVFVYPLLLGWLLHSYRSSPKILAFISGILGVMFIYLLAGNIFRMSEFFTFLNRYYQ